jgi:terminase small subunit / prophage DNA-packing protein
MSDPVALSGVGRLRGANKAEVAEFFDVSIPTIESWLRRGCPVVSRGSRTVPWVFDLLQVAEWRINGQRPVGDIDPDMLPPSERKAWYESETKKRDLQIKDRELIPASEVETVVATAFAAIAADIHAIPDNLERRHGIDSATAQAVEAALYEAMDGLADKLSTLAAVSAEG